MDTASMLAFAFQLAVMILFPLGLAIFFHRRFHVSWVVFFIALGFYIINLLLQIPFNFFLWPALLGKQQPWLSLALVTLTYGVCEETMRYLSFRAGRTMCANRTANGALMAGVGHGGAESILFALGTVITISTALLAPQTLKAQGLQASDVLGPWWYFIGSGLSRILAITVHLGFATLIVLAYRRTMRFYPLAILLHFIVDFSTFGLQLLTRSLWWTLLLFVLWAIIALAFILYVRRNNLAAEISVEPQDAAVPHIADVPQVPSAGV